jgi:hypothetical protein
MATFIALFNGLDLFNRQLELLLPPDSNELIYSKAIINKKDIWYNLPSNLEDKDDDSIIPSLILPM